MHCFHVQSVVKRLQPPRLASMVLIEPDVLHFEDPSAFRVNSPRITADDFKIDLLLGTQVRITALNV